MFGPPRDQVLKGITAEFSAVAIAYQYFTEYLDSNVLAISQNPSFSMTENGLIYLPLITALVALTSVFLCGAANPVISVLLTYYVASMAQSELCGCGLSCKSMPR